MLPATLLRSATLALVSKRFIATEAGKQKSDESSAESNRMLGLAYQGQGQLDLAWDKFRQVPLSDALLDNLYNLALDFERKRQFNKAESVFRYMHEFNPKFRDLESKLSRAQKLSETVMLGGAVGASRRLARPGGRREAEVRPLRGAEGARQGRDGRGVPRQGPEDRPRGGDQDDGAVAGVRGRGAGRGEGAVLPRGGDRRAPVAPEHRHDLRHRRGARPLLHRDGAPERRRPRALRQAGQPAAGRQGVCRSWRAPPTRSATRTSRTSCTATSSRRT